MIFSVGNKVVVNVNGTYKVGVVHSKTKLKKGWVYSINLEDGKTLERASLSIRTCHNTSSIEGYQNN